MGATGWLVVAGAIKMATDVPVELSSITKFFQPREGLLLLVLLAWTAVLWIVTKRIKHPLTLPGALVLASIAANLVLPLFGVSGKEAAAQGFLFTVSRASWPGIPALTGEYFLADWSLLLPVAGSIGAVVLIAVLQTLMLATGLEVTTRTEVDLDRESRAAGWANLASAALGGYVGQIALSATTVNRSAGGTTRITGFVVSMIALVSLLGAGSALEFIPRFVLGGALLVQGLRLVQEWAVNTYRALPVAEWLLVVAMIVITAWLGFIPAELAGLLAACVLFALKVSRIEVVRAVYGLDARTSLVARSDEETLFLAEHGYRVQVMELRGLVFFGSAHALRERVKAIVATRKPLMLIFDFSRVVGIDTSAAEVMVKVSRQLREAGVRQVVVGLSPAANRVIGDSGSTEKDIVKVSDIDEALEQGEAALLSDREGTQSTESSFSDWILATLGNAQHAAILQDNLIVKRYKSGDFLCRQGDPTDDLYFIEQGRLSAVLEHGASGPTRVRVFGPKTIVGEIAFVLDVPRTASLRVDEEAIVWSLGRPAFSALKAAHPDLAFELLQHVVRIQAERLSFATRRIAALN
jgi:SulP family sulfate permease